MLSPGSVIAAYAGLFVWSFLAATILPLASEPALIVLVRQGEPIWLLVTIATIGNTAGACTTYGLARGAAAALERRTKHRDRAAARLLERYGAPALLLSWVPLLGDAVVAAAGLIRINVATFLVWTTVGKAARYAIVAYAVR